MIGPSILIPPSAAFARHEAIVREMYRGSARSCHVGAWPLLTHELRALSERHIGLNAAKGADVCTGVLVFAPLPN